MTFPLNLYPLATLNPKLRDEMAAMTPEQREAGLDSMLALLKQALTLLPVQGQHDQIDKMLGLIWDNFKTGRLPREDYHRLYAKFNTLRPVPEKA